MKTICRALALGTALATLGLVSACGMAPKAEAPSSAGEAAPAPAEAAPTSTQASQEEAEREPTTLADAELLLERARADLDRLALNEPGAPATAGASAPPPAAAPSPAPARDEARRADKAAEADGAEKPRAKEVNACETACKAFSSLTRASDAVCRLDTEGGRCQRARKIHEDASQRVASCGCTK